MAKVSFAYRPQQIRRQSILIAPQCYSSISNVPRIDHGVVRDDHVMTRIHTKRVERNCDACRWGIRPDSQDIISELTKWHPVTRHLPASRSPSTFLKRNSAVAHTVVFFGGRSGTRGVGKCKARQFVVGLVCDKLEAQFAVILDDFAGPVLNAFRPFTGE